MQSDLPDHDLQKIYRLLSAYAQPALNRDEMLSADGHIKPVWQNFIRHLAQLGPDEIAKRFARGDQYLRDAGVLYRQYDETVSVEREWPLSHIPVILDQTEWDDIAAGLIQRAELLEHVVCDLYGANQLVGSGQLPGTLLSQNPAWLRPMVGVPPAKGHYLNLLSFEIGRGPDGKWWVISDLVDAPSTAGFAIENRVAVSRAFPNYFAQANIYRLAGFFQDLQRRLFDLRDDPAGQIAVLTSGPGDPNYAEHAYIARYLGLLLLQGEDLIVQNGQAMVRTVAGLKPLGVLWNRLSGAMCDPLELDPYSLLGTPGLLDALRAQKLNTLNAVGAGVLETRALMAFLPKIGRAYFGEHLRLPNIATWWCGHDSARDHVIANRDRMMVGSAFSTVPLMSDLGTTIFASERPYGMGLMDLLQQSGRELVGQEAITLSSTPSYEDGRLRARPMCIRMFVLRGETGWQVMPSGYARVSAGDDAKAFAMQRGGKVADVWVVGNQPVPTDRNLFSNDIGAALRQSANNALPSRAADNLFWLGRYVERAEQNMRLFRAYHARFNDGAPHDSPLLRFMRKTLMQGVAPDKPAMAAQFSDSLALGLQAANKISDRFSPDGMMALRALVATCRELDRRPVAYEEIPREISVLLRQITGFTGLVHENMYRSDGWRFLSLGISLERAANMAQILSQLTRDDAPDGAFNLALEVGDSTVSHRARYAVLADSTSVIDILARDAHNPRAIHYHITRARQHIAQLPDQSPDEKMSDVARRALIMETHLATSGPGTLTPAGLTRVQHDIWAIADALTLAYLV